MQPFHASARHMITGQGHGRVRMSGRVYTNLHPEFLTVVTHLGILFASGFLLVPREWRRPGRKSVRHIPGDMGGCHSTKMVLCSTTYVQRRDKKTEMSRTLLFLRTECGKQSEYAKCINDQQPTKRSLDLNYHDMVRIYESGWVAEDIPRHHMILLCTYTVNRPMLQLATSKQPDHSRCQD
ncbi:hypothetical protein F5Y17DRAFT_340108 [Xylariaceae sp. FL0594]|nr:hypothetical protein F5Y17DRAFT_340108 [Xylariaceae sp. FL0594]